MILSLVPPVLALTAIDSLKRTIAVLSHKVDSLEKVSLKLDVETDSFSNTLSSQVAAFSLIVGLIAVVAWGTYFAYLKSQLQRAEKTFNDIIEAQTVSFEAKITQLNKLFKSLEHENLVTSSQARRAIFFLYKDNPKYNLTSFLWALRLCDVYLRANTTDSLKNWLNKAKKYTPTSAKLVQYEAELRKLFERLKGVNDEDIKAEVTTLELTVMKTIYDHRLRTDRAVQDFRERSSDPASL